MLEDLKGYFESRAKNSPKSTSSQKSLDGPHIRVLQQKWSFCPVNRNSSETTIVSDKVCYVNY